jgi:acyl carrier protein
LAGGGFTPLTPEQALALWDTASALPDPLLIPMRIDMRKVGSTAPVLLRDLTGAKRPTANATAARTDTAALRRTLSGLSPAEAGTALTELVLTCAAAVLGHANAQRIQPDQAFADLGFDSLIAVEFRNRLSAATGVALPATITFDHPTPSAVGKHLLTALGVDGTSSVSGILAQLDGIDSAIEALGVDAAVRSAMTVRLQSIVTKLITPEAADGDAAVGDQIADASAEELVDFLSKEFGIS